MGSTGTALNIIKSYLTDRKQRIKVGNMLSDYDDIKYGVPQGTLLGPILFPIHIIDLIKITTGSSLTCYVNDAQTP